jgi:hypothetical protein
LYLPTQVLVEVNDPGTSGRWDEVRRYTLGQNARLAAGTACEKSLVELQSLTSAVGASGYTTRFTYWQPDLQWLGYKDYAYLQTIGDPDGATGQVATWNYYTLAPEG